MMLLSLRSLLGSLVSEFVLRGGSIDLIVLFDIYVVVSLVNSKAVRDLWCLPLFCYKSFQSGSHPPPLLGWRPSCSSSIRVNPPDDDDTRRVAGFSMTSSI
ncbi:hypothetical protein NE237_010912 [Protea cynaroides]|uniref:Uncharacterized protein n=1 Tax=Protea cynaroides TaxID=273540 RepID=A0A9Q0L0M8_9MAGN|nr:hypothetical protein NE237_010912 [Protea cynaroides]